MIVEFSVKNFRSIKEMQTISFVASNLKSASEYADVDENNIVEEGGMRLLKTVGIYGPNSSGKSNIIKAFQYFINFVLAPATPNPAIDNLHQPFLFQKNSFETESFFQIIFIAEGKKYRYGFTVKSKMITNEWLYGTSSKNMVAYFIRTGKNIDIKEPFKEAEETPKVEFEHNLFLTHVAAYKNGEAYRIWYYLYLSTVGGRLTERSQYRAMTLLHFSPGIVELYRDNKIMQFLERFDIQYDSIELDDSFNPAKASEYPFEKISVVKKGGKLNMALHESDGVSKLFDMAGWIINALSVGALIVQDELDSNFHPSLLIKLIGMFNDPKINVGKGQLLFTTHDTNLLSPSIMRRDQFYFVEKDKDDASRVYSLADLKGIRNDADFAKQYLAGFYGALPVLDNYLTEENVGKDE